MTLRTRLTLCYAGIMFCSLMLMAGFTYLEFAPEKGETWSSEKGDASDLRETLHILFWCGVPALLLAAGAAGG